MNEYGGICIDNVEVNGANSKILVASNICSANSLCGWLHG